MNRVPPAADSPDENPRPTGDSVQVFDQPSLSVEEQSQLLSASTSPTLDGRTDIDTAMLVALRRAMVTDHGLPISTARDHPGADHPGNLSQSFPPISALDGHPDIDRAVLAALRRASLGE